MFQDTVRFCTESLLGTAITVTPKPVKHNSLVILIWVTEFVRTVMLNSNLATRLQIYVLQYYVIDTDLSSPL